MLTVFFFFFRFRLDSSRCYFIDRWIRYLWSWLLLFLDFYCFIWSLLAPWGYFQFWLCSWIINMISLMFYLAILFLWFDFVPLDVISFLLMWFRSSWRDFVPLDVISWFLWFGRYFILRFRFMITFFFLFDWVINLDLYFSLGFGTIFIFVLFFLIF